MNLYKASLEAFPKASSFNFGISVKLANSIRYFEVGKGSLESSNFMTCHSSKITL